MFDNSTCPVSWGTVCVKPRWQTWLGKAPERIFGMEKMDNSSRGIGGMMRYQTIHWNKGTVVSEGGPGRVAVRRQVDALFWNSHPRSRTQKQHSVERYRRVLNRRQNTKSNGDDIILNSSWCKNIGVFLFLPRMWDNPITPRWGIFAHHGTVKHVLNILGIGGRRPMGLFDNIQSQNTLLLVHFWN